MGCHLSSISAKDGNTNSWKPDECSSPSWAHSLLTDKQKDIVCNTWRHLSDNMVNTGMRVFQYIFTRRPEVRNLFRFRHVEFSELPDDPYFRGHATHFMQAISVVVDNLDDLDTKLTPLLLALGEQHSKTRGFGIEYFEVFKQSLIIVWEERLGDKFTPEVRGAWEKLFVFTLMTLREGYAHVHDQHGKRGSNAHITNVTINVRNENIDNSHKYA